MRRFLRIIPGLFFLLGSGAFPDLSIARGADDASLWTANPGGDRPDDSYKYWDLIYAADPETLPKQEDSQSRVAVLQRGYGTEADILTALTIPPRKIREGELLSLIPPLKTGAGGGAGRAADVLVIPSGGLAESGGMGISRETLGRFVESGGVLIVLAQRFGGDYGAVPVPSGGPDLEGYGWLEDQSAMIGAAQPVSGGEPVTALKNAGADLNVDGFFTAIPRGARVFLRSSVSGQPVMVYYRLGKGAVLASTLFTDWALVHQRASREEVALFGRILAWAQSPTRLQEAERGGEEDRNSPSPLTFAVLSDHETYTLGSTAVFTITVWNHDNRTRTVNVYYDKQGRTLQVLPRRSARIAYAARIRSSHRLWVYFHDENGRFLQTLTRGVQVLFTPPLETTLRVEKEVRSAGAATPATMALHPGDPVRISLGLSGSGYPKERAEIRLKVFDPEHRVIHGETLTAALAGPSKTFSGESRFVLPADAVGGDYLVSTETVDPEGEKVGGESVTFELPLSLIAVTPELPERVIPRKKADVAFTLTNMGKTAVEKGGVSLQVRDPAGRNLYEASLPFALKGEERRTIRFPVAFPEVLLGDYRLFVTQWDETRRGVPVPVELPGEISAKALWNRAVYKVRETAELSLQISNAGPFEMDRLQVAVAVPDLSIRESQDTPLSAHGETTLFFRLPIPADAADGNHEVAVTFAAADSTMTRTFSIEVPGSSLSVLSNQPVYHAGEKILVLLSNSGGVDTEAGVRLSLVDLQEKPAAESVNTIPVAAGGNQPVYLTVPPGTVAGKYRLEIAYTDVKTRQAKQARQIIQIAR